MGISTSLKSTSHTTDVCVIILSYNEIQGIEQILLNLRGQLLTIRVIIWDNKSNAESVNEIKYLSEKYAVSIIFSDYNVGFAKGVNGAIRHFKQVVEKSEFILLLNQDCLLSKIRIDKMIDFLVQNSLDLVSPNFLNENECVDDEFTRIQNRIDGLKDGVLVEFTPAAFWMIRSDVFVKLGGFDERFFMYGEDLDFCSRLRSIGGRIGVNQNEAVIHPFRTSYKREIKEGYLLSVLLHPSYSLIKKAKVVVFSIARGIFSSQFKEYFAISVFIFTRLFVPRNRIKE